jgi:hypothetical protein
LTGNRTEDIVEITQTCARYSVIMTQADLSDLLSVFTPDGSYSAFGDTYPLSEFPGLVDSAPKGLYLTGTPAITFTGKDAATGDDTATGVTPLSFVIDRTHDQRIGYYNDTYQRTAGGWRIRTRSMTFIRRNGEHNHGIPHAHKNAVAKDSEA